jgi:transposase
MRETIEARGAALRYLPKYSPDLNPIEMLRMKSNGICSSGLRKKLEVERLLPFLRVGSGCVNFQARTRILCYLVARRQD